KSRFLFRGHQAHSSLRKFLSRSRIGVVPSRWENFPNTCIEMMTSGIPIIATRTGGIPEIVTDGRTGWLVGKNGNDGLAETLKRALNTPPSQLARMGRAASSDITQICDNKKIVASQLEFRSRIIQQGPRRSLQLPVNLPWPKRPLSDQSRRPSPQNRFQKGIAVVIACFNDGQWLEECLRRFQRQMQQPT